MSVRVKLSVIIDGMELLMDEMTSYLNKETGEVVTIMEEEFEAAEEDDDSLIDLYGLEKEGIEIASDILADESSAKYLPLPSKFDIHEWDIMRQFCVSIEDEEISQSLLNAIHGRGAFRYFKDNVHKFGIADQWYKYRDNAIKNIAIEWCGDNDIEYIDD
jgi:hypothetical protein